MTFVNYQSANGQISNQVLSHDRILAEINSAASEFDPLFLITHDQRQLLLLKFNWDIESLRNSFQEHVDTNNFLYNNGICPKNSTMFNKKLECTVCCAKGEVLGLRCKHMACPNCWNKYLTTKIRSGQCLLNCMEFGCNMLISNGMLGKFLFDPSLMSSHQKLIIDSYVKSNPNITWCNKQCGKAVKRSNGDTVICFCGSKFCFSCGQDPHLPATCNQILLFHKNRMNAGQSSTSWILGNTKECPRCTVPIEKRGGCDHMTCSNCGHQYCWVCLQNWQSHAAICERINVPVERSRSNTKANLLYQLRRYEFHHAIFEYEQQSLSLIEFGDVLVECRQVLLYSYVFGYFLEDVPYARSFDRYQLNFEFSVERLSENLSRHRHRNYSEILVLVEECQRLQKLLLGFCAKGGCRRSDISRERSRLNPQSNFFHQLRQFEINIENLRQEQLTFEFRDILSECHQILMYSYVFEQNLEYGPYSRSLFGSHQLKFENAVNRLSESLRRYREGNHSEILELVEECQRLQKLLRGIRAKGECEEEGRQMVGSFISFNDLCFVFLLVLLVFAACSTIPILFSAVIG